MPNPVVTNINNANLVLKDDGLVYDDDVVTFGGADTFVRGTILARDSVSGNLVVFAIGGSTNENGIPKAILAEPVTATGAGNLPCRVLLEGTVRQDLLVVDADGNASNVSSAVKDQLRDYGILVRSVDELNIQDNQT